MNTLEWNWATSSRERPKGVALVVHGLNLQPRRMQAVVELLTAEGIDALSLSLHGHGENYRDVLQVDTHHGPHDNFENTPCTTPFDDMRNENDYTRVDRFCFPLSFLRPFHAIDPHRIDARLRSFQTVTYSLWRQEMFAAYLIAHQRSLLVERPLILVAYSLGALLGALLLTTATSRVDMPDTGCQFAGMMFFSPALAIRRWCYWLKPLARYPLLIIPSLAPEAYRSNPGTPMAGYGALFDAHAHFVRADKTRLNIPTLVFSDPADELVSYAGLVRLIDKESLSKWELFTVTKSVDDEDDANRAVSRFHHLLVDADAVGEATWERMRARMRDHLRCLIAPSSI